MQRFIEAAKANQVTNIIRVCSDNLFLDISAIKQLASFTEKHEGIYDYVSYNIQGTPSIKTHYGFWTEYVSLGALEKVYSLTNESFYYEHVTNYIYLHPCNFSITWIDGPNCLREHPDIRLTIDTKEDFDNVSCIYENLCLTNPYPTIKDVVNYLDNHPRHYEIMHNQILKNSKQ